jgi:very-short-patch-repair endonuclease
LDFAWPRLRIALEYDGYEAHENRRAEDAVRDADLKRRGWKVIRADASDLRDPTRLFRCLTEELGVSDCGTRGV